MVLLSLFTYEISYLGDKHKLNVMERKANDTAMAKRKKNNKK